jgi:hypothetical protein
MSGALPDAPAAIPRPRRWNRVSVVGAPVSPRLTERRHSAVMAVRRRH